MSIFIVTFITEMSSFPHIVLLHLKGKKNTVVHSEYQCPYRHPFNPHAVPYIPLLHPVSVLKADTAFTSPSCASELFQRPLHIGHQQNDRQKKSQDMTSWS